MQNGYLDRQLPEPLNGLMDLAVDLRWASSQLARKIWERLDPDGWERIENPYLLLLNVDQQKLEDAARDKDLLKILARWREKVDEYHKTPSWFETTYEPERLKRVAYFSMEFGLSEALPIYSGGLGMLAGDHLKSASDLGVPLVGIGILYQQGYFRQTLADDGSQYEAFPYNDPSSLPIAPLIHNGRWHRVQLELPGRTLYLRVWQVRVGRVTLYLLDSNDALNSPWDRGITAHLYDAGRDKRLLQEIILGIGGWRLLEELGFDVEICHLNEGHAAFAVLARAAGFAQQRGISLAEAFRAVRAGNVFTTHTPVSAAFDEFDTGLIAHYAQPFLESLGLPIDRLLALGRADPNNHHEPFNMAYLAMHGCSHVNGVSQLHAHVSRRLFSRLFPGWPESQIPVGGITNGVHIPTWNSQAARALWVKASTDDAWLWDLTAAGSALGAIDLAGLWTLRTQARLTLIEYVRRRLARQLGIRGATIEQIREAGHVLDPNALTLGFARRFTEYKRPNLLLRDADRLRRILLNSSRPVQLIVAGKAHPNDEQGKQMVREMARFAMGDDVRLRVVFLDDYDMALGQHLAAGVDVWLNTPRRPAEACGTSGMKMLFNGGLNLSSRDGWWDEAWTPQVGWEIGEGREDDPATRDQREAQQLYEVLEQQVVPEFYQRDEAGLPHLWLQRVQDSMSQLTARFSSDRMVKDYVEQAYLPAVCALRQRTDNDAKLALEISEWKGQLAEHWHDLHFGDVHVSDAKGCWRFCVQAYLGEMPPDAIRVELFAECPDTVTAYVKVMERKNALPGTINGFAYEADVPADRPPEHYTARLVPWHPAAFIPAEESRIVWQH